MLNDYIYQSLVHMGNASHQLSWGLTVLDHANVPKEVQEEIRLTVIEVSNAIREMQEKLRVQKSSIHK
ncbi:hypothetical protein [Paenibacillus polymyxa]|uniref:hypothetical protein n=1 Tax=Paenibacillus polymyxa TaxID=1406 RepID=UPI0039BCF2A6